MNMSQDHHLVKLRDKCKVALWLFNCDVMKIHGEVYLKTLLILALEKP
jgi:hypothetical protein